MAAFYSTTYSEPPLKIEEKEKTVTDRIGDTIEKISEGFEETTMFVSENVLLILFIIGVLIFATYVIRDSSKK